MATFTIGTADLGFSTTDPGVSIGDAVLSAYSDFSIQVTSGLLVARANFSTTRVEQSFREAAEETTAPVKASWSLRVRVKQDPDDDATTGLAKFLYDNDSGETNAVAYFYLGLATGQAPKAIGACYLTPQDFGGVPGQPLYADLEFPVDGRPDIEFGTTPDV